MEETTRSFQFFLSDRGTIGFMDRPNTLNYFVFILFTTMIVFLALNFINIMHNLLDGTIIISMFILFSSYVMLIYVNIAPEVKIDNHRYYIRKIKNFKAVPLSHIDFIKFTPLPGGLYFLRIKKRKGIDRLPVRFAFICVQGKFELDQFNAMLAELKKITTIKKAWTL